MPPLTGAQKQKRHADKLKAELGEEEYKRLMKIKNKKKYDKLKNKQDDNDDKNDKDDEEDEEEMYRNTMDEIKLFGEEKLLR